MAKKKQFNDALHITDQVMKSVVGSLILKMHMTLCGIQQSTGYVPYHRTRAGGLTWTDYRRRGRSTFGDIPTITYVCKDTNETIYIWWNRHTGAKLDVMSSVNLTLDVVHQIDEDFAADMKALDEHLQQLAAAQKELFTLAGVETTTEAD